MMSADRSIPTDRCLKSYIFLLLKSLVTSPLMARNTGWDLQVFACPEHKPVH